MSAPERVRPPTVRPPTAQRRSSRLRAVLAAVIVLGPRHRRRVPRRSQVPGLAADHRPGGDRDGLRRGCQPFMTPGGTDLAVPALPDASTTASGSSAGLYGAIRNSSSCNSPAMVEYLVANEAKASAWAGILKIEVPAIPAYGHRASSREQRRERQAGQRPAHRRAYRGTNRSATTRAGQDVQRLAHPGAARCAELQLLRRPADQRLHQHDRPARRLGHGHHAR